jgi:hypothetical protein
MSIRTGTHTGFELAAAVLIAESAGLVGSALLLYYEHSEIVCLSVLIISSLLLQIPSTHVFYSKRSTYIRVSCLFARTIQ